MRRLKFTLLITGIIVTLVLVAVPANAQCQWVGESYVPGTNNYVRALTVYEDSDGPALYAGGEFTAAGGVSANHIAKWDGTSWSALGSGMIGGPDPVVYALTVYDDGNGPALYAGGQFTIAGGVSANRIAKWDGTNWSALGLGMSEAFPAVYALTVYDDGNGPALYAGGSFTIAGGVLANRIAKWDGSSWSALGSGMSGGPSAFVRTLTVYDKGNGPALYAGGFFTTAGGVPANHIARWDGTSWSALGSGMSGGGSPIVLALTVYDDGNGPALYAGGQFTAAGGVMVNGIAKWDGTSWSALGSGMSGDLTPGVHALTVYDDGNGPALYAGGFFTTAGGVTVNGIAKWDGTSWSALGSGMSGDPSPVVLALTVYDDGNGPALYAGGDFNRAGGEPSSHVAAWRCQMP